MHVCGPAGLRVIGGIEEGGFLEGGDFFAAGEDLALVGIGLRSNFEACQQLMDRDLLGTHRLAIVKDENECHQVGTSCRAVAHRQISSLAGPSALQHCMHLDCVFICVPIAAHNAPHGLDARSCRSACTWIQPKLGLIQSGPTELFLKGGFRPLQDRMHLDCVFSILGDRCCLMLEEMIGEDSKTARYVDEYTRDAFGEHPSWCCVQCLSLTHMVPARQASMFHKLQSAPAIMFTVHCQQ